MLFFNYGKDMKVLRYFQNSTILFAIPQPQNSGVVEIKNGFKVLNTCNTIHVYNLLLKLLSPSVHRQHHFCAVFLYQWGIVANIVT